MFRGHCHVVPWDSSRSSSCQVAPSKKDDMQLKVRQHFQHMTGTKFINPHCWCQMDGLHMSAHMFHSWGGSEGAKHGSPGPLPAVQVNRLSSFVSPSDEL